MLNELFNQYYGTEDDFFEHGWNPQTSFKHDGIVKERRCYEFVTTEATVIQHYLHEGANSGTDAQSLLNEAYTNLLIKEIGDEPSGNIVEVGLETGGSRIEQTCRFRYLNIPIELYQMSEGRAIPALKIHENRLYIKTSGLCRFELSYDVTTGIDNNEESTDLIMQEQYGGTETITGTETISGTVASVVLGYNHPISCIYVHLSSNEDVTDIRLMLDDKDYDLVFLKQHGYYILDFGKETLNFSRINRAALRFTRKSTTPVDVNVFAIGRQFIQRMSGMAGAMFTK